MTTESAIRAMLDGKKVNRKDFVEEVYAYEKGVFFNQYGMTIQSFGDNDDWEIYEEPKPKQIVTIEKWLCSVVEDSYYVIEGTKEFMSGRSEKVKLIDTYEVTFEIDEIRRSM